VHDPKPKRNALISSAKSRMDANMQLTINSFRPLFPDKIFPWRLPWLLGNPWHFPDSCQIPRHFQFSRQGSPCC